MITEVSRSNGSEISIYPDESHRCRRTYYCKEEDVIANGDGSFTIEVPGQAKDADKAYTKDTGRLFLHDEDIDAWWEQ